MAKLTGSGRNKSRQKLYTALDELYGGVYSDGKATASGSATSTVNAAESVPLMDSAGTIIGYIAVYGDANLTTP